ncbi:hypothetical protein F1188_20200 [Roseospira marina]|uniref:Uncharacterized protein n=1 Tax=Roseospira marina TaxID=140057 RepID=A0A5M6I5D2_9PROT|nr:hypothetical protein [Roseospira marina]KAA5603009.1 hypothetical protein F1188_20200 [Roseospira marina]MBB4313028.1 hypothetical protein [Roseospira marina]MBB5089291.1 hypothetical protein [Roseospira marina]
MSEDLGHPAERRALDVEALLTWAYRDERVHEAVAAQVRDVRVGPSQVVTGTAAVARVLEQGGRVDQSWAPDALGDHADRVDPDALAVHGLVMEVNDTDPEGRLAELVIACALRGRRPETFDGIVPRPIARRRGANDRPVVVYADPKARVPLYCPVDYHPTRADIETARLMYVRWWVALEWLGTYLPDVLQGHEITGFFAGREPWREAA